MKYAVIAAGEGSRLAKEGVASPKPLVEVGGERLIDRLVRVFSENGATEIDVICNKEMTDVQQRLVELRSTSRVPIRFIVKSTPSSMHSMWELSRWLGDEPFVLTTVDTIFREEEFGAYVADFQRMVESGEADGLMGVTDYIDDEKPLYVGVGDDMTISGFYDEPHDCRYISAGIYGLRSSAKDIARQQIEQGTSRMRNFQRALVAAGLAIKAHPFSKVLDIDHREDIEKAEELLNQQSR